MYLFYAFAVILANVAIAENAVNVANPVIAANVATL